MQPDRILSYASDGLTAALYRGRYAPPSNRIVIMLGGSDGSYALTQTYAAVFAENGLTALAVPYWGQPHLAQGLAQIAVETVETAGAGNGFLPNRRVGYFHGCATGPAGRLPDSRHRPRGRRQPAGRVRAGFANRAAQEAA